MTVQVQGARLHYRFDGPSDAPVVVLANSLGTSLAMWDGQVSVLTQRFRVLRYDMRGHGESTVSAEPFDVGRLGRDVVDLLDHLQLERVNFCGLSLGGMVGLWLGSHAPLRLEKLMLCNTAAAIGSRASWDERIAAVETSGMASVVPAILARWFTPEFRARESAAVERCSEMLIRTKPRGYTAACAAVRDMDLREEVSEVRVPTLVVAGQHDFVTPPAEGRWLAEHIEGARYVELPAAHLSNIEAEASFNESVSRFFTEEETAIWTSAID